MLEKPKVCRRLNLKHTDDEERLIKDATINRLVRSVRQLQLEDKAVEELPLRKRGRGDDEEAKVVTKRTIKCENAKKNVIYSYGDVM